MSVATWDVLDRRLPGAGAEGAADPVGLRSVGHADWDRHIARFDDASYEQTAVFAAARWSADRVEAFACHQRERLIGGAVAVRISPPGTRIGLYHVKFGPVWRTTGVEAEPAVYDRLLKAMRDEICNRRGSLLTIVPRPNPDFVSLEADRLAAHGFVATPPSSDPYRYLVDLKADVEPLSALSQKWRYNLKRARANGLQVSEIDAIAGHDAFSGMHRAMLERKRYPSDETVDAVPDLARTLASGLRPRIFLAHADGQPVAGAVVGSAGDTASYLFGATTERGLKLKAGYVVQWAVVEALRQGGPRWYDLGGDAGDSGLRQFKRGLVGRQGRELAIPGEFRGWSRPSARLIGDLSDAARTARRHVRAIVCSVR